MVVEFCQCMSPRKSHKADADHLGSNPQWLAQPAASARLMFRHSFDVTTKCHGAVFCNGNQRGCHFEFNVERLRDRIEVWASPLFLILIGLCEDVYHEKLSRTLFTLDSKEQFYGVRESAQHPYLRDFTYLRFKKSDFNVSKSTMPV